MKKLYILFFAFFYGGLLYSQDSQMFYHGIFLHKSKAQKNLIVTNKNSGDYDFTNENGYLMIKAKTGDTLVYNKKDLRIIYSSDLKDMKTILNSKIKYEDAKPILSKDYITENNITIDPLDFLQSKVKANKDSPDFVGYQSITRSKDGFDLKIYHPKNLFFSGSFQFSTEFGSANTTPKLQRRFVQGRNLNGNLNWNGSETGELFSFGPDISSLGFDGTSYEYDVNGRLVAKNYSISPAKIYNNSILQQTQKSSNFLAINSYFKKDNKKIWEAGLDMGWVREDLLLKDQYQDSKNFGISFGRSIFEKISLKLNYRYNEQKATNTNRIGLFNRAYKSALLTPISFDNDQGDLLLNKQRSFSAFADNPNYLLQNIRKYNFNYYQNTINLKLEKNKGDLRYGINQTYESTQFSNVDRYKKYTVGFPSGKETERDQINQNYTLNIDGNYTLNGSYSQTHKLFLNSIFNSADTKITYDQFRNYKYDRLSLDNIFLYEFKFRDVVFRNFDLEGEIGNGFYSSNTALKNEYFIPKISLLLNLKELIDHNFSVKIYGSLYQNYFEPNFNKSYSNYAITQIDDQQLDTYFPIQEIRDIRGLYASSKLETKFGMIISPSRNVSLEGSFSQKKYKNDVFPIFENGEMVLKNLADHKNLSYDLFLNTSNFPFRNSDLQIGFNKTISKVTDVLGQKNYVPIAGFNSVYRGIVADQPLGVLVGSAYQRNKNGDLLIGNDGFPLVSADQKIIGNPIPDFVMKFSYKQAIAEFSLNVDLEWRNGGDIWNGTQANLDHYGRSENSAQQRNITNFVYGGVLPNGDPNTVPVDLYDLNLPFEQNKWYRYGSLGVAEDHIVKGDAVRINNISLAYNLREIKPFDHIKFSVFAQNILLWSKNKIDSQTSFYDNENGQGLDFYNIPSMRSYGLKISFLF